MDSITKIKQLIVLATTIFFIMPVFANPVLGNVAAGSVTVQQTTNTTNVNQASKQAIINWQSFNIGNQQLTHFQQPAGGIALNRINGTQGPSSIFGTLTATGQIILLNPAGIFFGPSAYVNVGGLIASTANITDQNFLNNNYQFDAVPGYSGAIINKGQLIAAQHGLIALVAPGVVNNGMIKANLGHVILASGDAFTVNFAGNDLINFTITTPTSHAGVAPNGKVLRNGVSNTGAIYADGGEILVTASAAQGVLDHIINMQGIAEAKSVGTQNGEIIISGDPSGGVVRIAGKLIATGKHSGQTGGNVTVTGNDILLDNSALIDVSGDAGGGNILIGGDAHGAGPLPNASATVMMPGAKLLANAITSGNGGQVVLWSDNVTKAYGTIQAEGGALSGNGGYVETSGGYLDVNGINVNTSAANGALGTWLLDPSDLTISNGTTSNVTQVGGLFTANNNSTTSILNNTTLETELGLSNVTVETTAGGTGAGSGNITVANNINWASNNSLTLSAFDNLIINAGVTISNTTSSTAGLTLQANNAAAFEIGTGVGTGGNVTNSGTIDMKGPVTIFYNPTNTTYTPTVFTNTGTGALTAYMLVNSATDLQDISNNSASWSGANADFALNTNIDATSLSSFTPIGTSAKPFLALFNGQNFTISNLTINEPTATNVGLFGFNEGTIENLGLINANITGKNEVGALVGDNDAGGIISNTYSTGSVTGAANGSEIGGLVGQNGTGEGTSGALIDSYSTANVTGASGVTDVGGLVGLNNFTITSSYSGGTVTGNGASDVGGLVGENINITEGSSFVGILNSYSISSVIGGTGSNIGGLLGDNLIAIENTYSSGAVTGTGTGIGGLVGANAAGGTATSSYWDTQTSGQASSAIGTGKTTAQLMTAATFTGWNITSTPSTTATPPADIWFIFPGGTRPILLSEYSTNVTNAHQLQLMGSTLGATYTIANNINLASAMNNTSDIWGTNEGGSTGAGFVPIGNTTNTFTGTLNGGNFQISNLYIDSANNDLGLFGDLSGSGNLSNLTVSGTVVGTGSASDVALLLGLNSGGTITGITTSGAVTGTTQTGGVIGFNNTGSASNLTNSATVTGTTNVGGVAGESSSALSDVFNTGLITGSSNVGGLVGNDTGAITDGYNGGNVTASSTGQTGFGGVIGLLNGAITISNVYNAGIVSAASNSDVGGVVGNDTAASTLNGDYNIGEIIGTSGTAIGGVVGNLTTGSITNTYNTGFLSATGGTDVGGIAGLDSAGAISNSYNAGFMTGTTNVGGLVGSAGSALVTNSYWDTQATGQGTSSGGGTPETTAAMMTQGTFTGFNFGTIWGIIAGQSYPYLLAFYPTTPRAISGTTAATGGTVVKLAVGGSVFDAAFAGSDGLFYFLEGNNAISNINHSIADNAALLVYIDSGATLGNAVNLAPTGGASISNFNIAGANTIAIGGSNTVTIANSDLATAAGALVDPDILYSVSGNNLTIGNATNTNVNLTTSATTTYDVNGTIAPTSGGTGSYTFNGPVAISSAGITSAGNQIYNGAVTLTSSPSIVSGSGSTTFASTVNGVGETLTLQNNTGASTGTVTFDNDVTLAGLTTFAEPYAVILDGALNTFTNPVTFLNTAGVTLGNAGTFNFNGGLTSTASTTTSDGTVNTNGNILDLGTITLTGNSSFNSAGGTLSIGTTDSNVSGTNNLILSSGAGALNLNGVIGGTHPLNTFTASNTGAANNIVVANNINTANNISLTAGDNVNLTSGSLTSSGGNVFLTGTAGLVEETGAGIITGALLTTNSVTGTTLGNNNVLSSFAATNTTSGNVSFTNTGALSLAGIDQTGGNLTINNTGALTQSAPITVSGTSDFSTGANPMTLTSVGNDFTGAVSLNNSGNNNVALVNSVALVLGTSSVGTGTLQLTGAGLTQTGAIVQAAGAGAVTLNGGGDAIALTNGGNDFTGPVSFSNVGNNNVALVNDALLTLGTSSLGTGTLQLTGVGLAQTGAITEAAGAGAVTLNGGAGAITFNNAGNDFSGAVSLDNSGNNNVVLVNDALLTLGTSSLGTGTLQLTGAGLAQTGAIVQAAGAGAVTLNGGGDAIALTNAGNDFTGPVSFSNVGNNNVALVNDALLTLGTSSLGTGTLQLTGVGLTQTGAITEAAGAGAVTLNGGAGAINFNNAGNDFTGAVSLNNSGNNNVTLVNSGALSLGTSSVGTGTLQLTGAGLTQTGAIVQAAGAGAVTLNGGGDAITLANAGNDFTGPVSFSNVGNNNVALVNDALLTLGTSSLGTGTLQLTGVGLAQTGAITEAAGAGAVTLNGGAGAITFNNAGNDFSGAVSLDNSGNNNVVLVNSGALSLGTSSVGTGTLQLTGAGLTQTGAITQAAGAGAVTLNGGGDAITLTNAGNNFTGPVSFTNVANNNVTLNDAGALTLGASTIGSGTINVTDAGILTIAGALTTADGNIDLSGAAINLAADVVSTGGNILFSSPLTLTTPETVNSGNGSLTFASTVSGAGETLTLQNNTAATGTVTFDNNVTLGGLTTFAEPYAVIFDGAANNFTNAVTFLNTNGVTLANGGNFNGGITNAASTTTFSGAINTSNALVSLSNVVLNGSSAINTGSGSILLGPVNGANNLTLTSSTGSTLNGNVNISNLTLNGGGTDTINTPLVTTSGTQSYNDAVILGMDTTLTAGATVALNNGTSGNKNLNVDANVISMTGALALNNVAILGTGSNTFFALNTFGTQNWEISSTNGGSLNSITGVTGPFTFTNINNLVGGSGADTFAISGGTLSGGINGQGGNNTLIGDNVSDTFNVTGANAGAATGLGGGFANIQNLTGGSVSNRFLLSGGSVAGNINGGTSTNNTLTANPNLSNAWSIFGTDNGTVTGVGGQFINIQNLNGGNSGNSFIFADNANLTGLLNGGSLAGLNTLNYLSYSTPISVSLTAGIYQGTTYNSLSSSITNYVNINNLVGNGSLINTLTLPNKQNTLVITAPLTGYINDPLTFSGFTFFVSQSGIDKLIFTLPATIDPAAQTGTVDGITMDFINFFDITVPTLVPEEEIQIPSLLVYPIIQQPELNALDNGAFELSPPWSLTSDEVDQNINDIMSEAQQAYDTNLHQIKINPYCTGNSL